MTVCSGAIVDTTVNRLGADKFRAAGETRGMLA